MFALPGLPALAAKSRGDHPCREVAEQRDFYGTEPVTDEKVVVNGAEVTLGSNCIVAASQEGARAASHSRGSSDGSEKRTLPKISFL
jgi:hypothetical protein